MRCHILPFKSLFWYKRPYLGRDLDIAHYHLKDKSHTKKHHQDNEKIAKIEGVSEDIEDDITSSPFDKLKDIDLD